MSLDDQLRAAQRGEPRAKQRLFANLRRQLIAYFRRRIPHDDVEDQAQESLAIISKEVERFEAQERDKFRSFVFGVAFNRMRTYRRQKDLRRREREDPGTWVADEPDLEDKLLWEERRAKLRAVMSRIRTTVRVVIEGQLTGRTLEEIAEAHDLKPGTARRLASEAADRVRDALVSSRQNTPEPR